MKIISVTLVFIVSLIPAQALADGDPIEVAKREFEEGKGAFERGQYEVALQHFLEAEKIAPAPSLTYNIGLVYERMGRYTEAAAAFDKYLEQLPAPTTKDERQFRDNLKQRAKAARDRAAQGAPPPNQPPPNQPPPNQPPPNQPGVNQPPPNQPRTNQPPPNQPPPYYYGQQPYYPYQPYQPYGAYGYPVYQKTPQQKLDDARARRGRAIALLAVGLVLNVAGIGVVAWGVSTPLSSGGEIGPVNYAVDWFGGTLMVVGITLWAPGAASFVKSSKDIVEAQRELDKLKGPGRAPTTFIFNAPAISF